MQRIDMPPSPSQQRHLASESHFLRSCRMCWKKPLLLYELSISTIAELERRVSCFIRKWLGLPKSSIDLCGNIYKLRLPLKSSKEKLKIMWVREVLEYPDSSDCKASEARVTVKTGRKWRVEMAVVQADSNSDSGQSRTTQTPCYDKAHRKKLPDLVS